MTRCNSLPTCKHPQKLCRVQLTSLAVLQLSPCPVVMMVFMLSLEPMPMTHQQAASSTCVYSPGWQCCSFLAALCCLPAAGLQAEARDRQLLSIASCSLRRAGCPCGCPALLLGLHHMD